MASKYKLTYFQNLARGEVARLLFAQAGVEYGDCRITMEDWPKLKEGTPFGKLPILEVDGITLAQSHPIERFLAQRFGLAGKTEIEQAFVNMVVDHLADYFNPVELILWEENQATKHHKMSTFEKEDLPKSLAIFEKLLISNQGGDGYFVGDQITWADICFADLVTWPARLGLTSYLDAVPKLNALKQRVEAQPNIAAWLEKRPIIPAFADHLNNKAALGSFLNMTGKYKLIYYHLRGRAEVARLLFAHVGVEYEDCRIAIHDWPEYQKHILFGKLPILEFDGLTLAQSHTIERFLAQRFGLAGKTEIEQAFVNMIVDYLADTFNLVGLMYWEQDQARKHKMLSKFEKKVLPESLAVLEKLLISNQGGDGYFVGDQITWADICFADLVVWPTRFGFRSYLDAVPKLKALKQRVEAQPNIAAWIKKRSVELF